MFVFPGKAWPFTLGILKKFLNTEAMQFFIAKFIPPSSEGAFPEDQLLGIEKDIRQLIQNL